MVVKESIILLAASRTVKTLHVFDYQAIDIDSTQLELLDFPLKLLNSGERMVIVIYEKRKRNSMILTSSNKQVVIDPVTVISQMYDRHMDADTVKGSVGNKHAIVMALLYDENKVDLFLEQDFSLVKTLVINEWSDDLSTNKGYIIMLPHSDFLAVAKQGETVVWLKNYGDLNTSDRGIQTAFSSILQINLSPEHKILTVFDAKL